MPADDHPDRSPLVEHRRRGTDHPFVRIGSVEVLGLHVTRHAVSVRVPWWLAAVVLAGALIATQAG